MRWLAAGCAAISGTVKQCINADRDGNGMITVDALVAVINNVIGFASGTDAMGHASVTLTNGPMFVSTSIAWMTENGPGGFAFTFPAEEGSAQFTGDGANAGFLSHH